MVDEHVLNNERTTQESGFVESKVPEGIPIPTPIPVPTPISSHKITSKLLIGLVSSVLIVGAYFAIVQYKSTGLSGEPGQLSESNFEYSLALVKGWKVYTSQRLGFSFQYPEEFFDIEASQSGVSLIRKPQEPENLGWNDQISISVSDKGESIEKSLGGITAFIDPSALEKQNITIDGRDAVVLTYSETKQGKKETLLTMYAFEYGQRVYTLMTPDGLPEKIIKTFEFYEPIASKSLKDILWKTFKFEAYGFEFKLPEDWEQIESKRKLDNTNAIALTFSPIDAEYGTRPDRYDFEILISPQTEDVNLDSKIEEWGKENGAEKITVGGKPAMLVYNQPDFKEDPLIFMEVGGKSISLLPGPESAFSHYDSFQELLSTLKFFEPYGTTNSSQPVKKEEITDRGLWCSKAPVPGHCYMEIAQTEQKVQVSWCEAVTPENSGERVGNKGFYYYYKNFCYTSIAPKLKDISLCNKMEGEGLYEGNKTNAIKECKSLYAKTVK